MNREERRKIQFGHAFSPKRYMYNRHFVLSNDGSDIFVGIDKEISNACDESFRNSDPSDRDDIWFDTIPFKLNADDLRVLGSI